MEWADVLRLEKRVEATYDWRHRPQNRYTSDGLALVSKVWSTGGDLKTTIRESVDLIGGFRKALNPGEKVLIKANFNSADPLPAATDLPFLIAVVELLQEEGITDLTVGERSGFPAMPTSGVLERLGVFAAAKEMGFRVINFEDGPWMGVRLGDRAKWWNGCVTLHSSLREFDRIVYLPCMKTHFLAGFTMSLKLNVGMTHPAEMPYMHADFRGGKPEEPMFLKMLELALPVGPDLIIMDGRKAFVTNGPITGEMVEPGVILTSGDRIALDVEGVKVLQQYPRDNKIQMPVWDIPYIRRAVELGLGVASEAEYRVITRDS
jgi:uncharacterized protein (DUF362 family)